MPDLVLDRMAVDDVATSPERVAAAIHRQLGEIEPPVPVHAIAHALDIAEIREAPVHNFEGLLVTDATRDFGLICVNSNSSPYRRRYSIAHELGHFLCAWHAATNKKGFLCTRQDMAMPTGDAGHMRQESEANLFAIALLAPKRLMLPRLRRLPDLEQVLAIHSALEISRIAAARRYVALHGERLAAVFAKDRRFQYVSRGDGFPYLAFQRNDPLPLLPPASDDVPISEMVEGDAEDWRLQAGQRQQLWMQMLRQEQGHAIILLHLTDDADQGDAASPW